MLRKLIFVSSAFAVVTSIAASASAQQAEEPYLDQHIAMPKRALELTVGTGYTQPFGLVQSGVGFPSVANAGVGVDLGVGYRLDPRVMIGISGQYQELNAEHGTGTRGFSAGPNATLHFNPGARIDPWAQLGVGYRFLWETNASPTPDIMLHGFQLAKLAVGFDVRTTAETAIGPLIGADLNMFLWESPSNGSAISIKDPRLNTFVYAGVQGRFDIGTQTEPTTTTVAHR